MAQEAKNAGAVGAPLTAVRRHLRNSMIVARAAVGTSLEEIADEAQVDERTVQRVLSEAADAQTGLDARPMELVEAMVREFGRSIADYESMAYTYADSNPSVALGAKKAADETRTRLAVLLERVGKLPSNLELFRSEMEMREEMRWLTEQLLSVRDGDVTLEDTIESFRRRMEERQRERIQTALPPAPSG